MPTTASPGSLSAISAITNINQPSTATASSGLGPNSFLQLLTTELQNQDPTQPEDPTQSVTQLAQMSQLQYQEQLTTSFASFQSNFAVLQSASLIGKSATVNTGTSSTSSTSSTVTGTIASVTIQNGSPYFTMTNSNGTTMTDSNGNPLLFSTSQIVALANQSPSSTSGTTASSGASASLMRANTPSYGF